MLFQLVIYINRKQIKYMVLFSDFGGMKALRDEKGTTTAAFGTCSGVPALRFH